jgi:ABC-type proline/glycine betaine transport system permease subunit
MSDGITAIIFAAGFGAWVYNKMMHSTNSQHSALVGTVVSAAIAFIVIFTLMKYVFHF